jgi:D-alanyl-D-alanine carboxypeptidase (penicillin-binding protein 5/6)
MSAVPPHRVVALLMLLLVTLLAPLDVLAQNGRAPSLSAECVLLVDPEGRVLFAKNDQDSHAPASLVKLMTLYLAYEDLEAGRVHLDDMARISHAAATTPRYRMGLKTNTYVPFHTLLEGVAIASANDAATAVAEHLGGDEASFVARMNLKAQALGLTGTHYANPHGLPDASQRSTARDLAELTNRLLRDHPDVRTMLGGQTFVYKGRVYTRHIPLFSDPGGVQALKTGFTNEAGYNLSVSAWRGGQQFVMIVMGARTRQLSFLDAKKLLRFGFVEAGLEAPGPEPRVKAHPAAPTKRSLRARRASTR